LDEGHRTALRLAPGQLGLVDHETADRPRSETRRPIVGSRMTSVRDALSGNPNSQQPATSGRWPP
jgi:hypothetical protein